MAETKSTHGEYTINGPKKNVLSLGSHLKQLIFEVEVILTHTYLSSEVGG